VVSRNTTPVLSLGLRIGRGRPQRWHAKRAYVTPNKRERKKERERKRERKKGRKKFTSNVEISFSQFTQLLSLFA